MVDSTHEYASGRDDELRARLERDGFIFLRGVVPHGVATAARMAMVDLLDLKGAIRCEAGAEKADGFIQREAAMPVQASVKAAKKRKARGT